MKRKGKATSSDNPKSPSFAMLVQAGMQASMTGRGNSTSSKAGKKNKNSDANASQGSSRPSSTDPSDSIPEPQIIGTGDAKRFLCLYPGCNRHCGRLPDYRKHYRIHLPDRPFPCRTGGDQCKKVFKDASTRCKHERTHLDVKYTCPECQTTFSRKDNLATHRKARHAVKAAGSKAGFNQPNSKTKKNNTTKPKKAKTQKTPKPEVSNVDLSMIALQQTQQQLLQQQQQHLLKLQKQQMQHQSQLPPSQMPYFMLFNPTNQPRTQQTSNASGAPTTTTSINSNGMNMNTGSQQVPFSALPSPLTMPAFLINQKPASATKNVDLTLPTPNIMSPTTQTLFLPTPASPETREMFNLLRTDTTAPQGSNFNSILGSTMLGNTGLTPRTIASNSTLGNGAQKVDLLQVPSSKASAEQLEATKRFADYYGQMLTPLKDHVGFINLGANTGPNTGGLSTGNTVVNGNGNGQPTSFFYPFMGGGGQSLPGTPWNLIDLKSPFQFMAPTTTASGTAGVNTPGIQGTIFELNAAHMPQASPPQVLADVPSHRKRKKKPSSLQSTQTAAANNTMGVLGTSGEMLAAVPAHRKNKVAAKKGRTK